MFKVLKEQRWKQETAWEVIYIFILLSQRRFLQRFPKARREKALPTEEIAVQRKKVEDSSSSVNCGLQNVWFFRAS